MTNNLKYGLESLKIFRKFLKKRNAFVGTVIVLICILVALVADLIATHDPIDLDTANAHSPPSAEFLFGTDNFGRDIYSRIIYGVRYSLAAGLISVVIGLFIGAPLGLISGYVGGIFDGVLMRIIDVLQSFPGILLALVIVSILGAGFSYTMIAIGIGCVPVFARLLRGEVLKLMNEDYIKAAIGLGVSPIGIIFHHLIPNTLSTILVISTLMLPSAILSAAALGFLGLGAGPEIPEWGAMLSTGRNYIMTSWWITTFPGLAIMLTVLGFNMLGDGLRDTLDPRLKV